jgi:hypothetical protein
MSDTRKQERKRFDLKPNIVFGHQRRDLLIFAALTRHLTKNSVNIFNFLSFNFIFRPYITVSLIRGIRIVSYYLRIREGKLAKSSVTFVSLFFSNELSY